MWKIPLTDRGLEIKHLGHVNLLNVKWKILVSEDASGFRVEHQLKEALELTPSGFPL